MCSFSSCSLPVSCMYATVGTLTGDRPMKAPSTYERFCWCILIKAKTFVRCFKSCWIFLAWLNTFVNSLWEYLCEWLCSSDMWKSMPQAFISVQGPHLSPSASKIPCTILTFSKPSNFTPSLWWSLPSYSLHLNKVSCIIPFILMKSAILVVLPAMVHLIPFTLTR